MILKPAGIFEPLYIYNIYIYNITRCLCSSTWRPARARFASTRAKMAGLQSSAEMVGVYSIGGLEATVFVRVLNPQKNVIKDPRGSFVELLNPRYRIYIQADVKSLRPPCRNP